MMMEQISSTLDECLSITDRARTANDWTLGVCLSKSMMQHEFSGVSAVDVSKYNESFITWAGSISGGTDSGVGVLSFSTPTPHPYPHPSSPTYKSTSSPYTHVSFYFPMQRYCFVTDEISNFSYKHTPLWLIVDIVTCWNFVSIY